MLSLCIVVFFNVSCNKEYLLKFEVHSVRKCCVCNVKVQTFTSTRHNCEICAVYMLTDKLGVRSFIASKNEPTVLNNFFTIV